MKKFQGRKGTMIIAFMALLVIGYYFYLSNKEYPERELESVEVNVMTPTQLVLTRDLEKNYPPSPREVVRYFSEITQCFYNEEYTEEELKALAFKIRQLYDDELAANQTDEEYLANLKFDIEQYKNNNRTIANYAITSSLDVEEFQTEEGYQWARLNCIYSIKENVLYNSNIQFLLRKDSDGKYKIYGWRLEKQSEES